MLIEISDLRGNIQCFPESDSNFPESPVQKEARYQTMLSEAGKNPVIAKLLNSAKNLKVAKDAVGFNDLDIPEEDSENKQLAEIDILLKGAPIPNPAITQAQTALGSMATKGAPPEAIQQATQQIQQAQQQMPEISTVDVDDKCDNHAVEAATCLRWINSPAGRKARNGTPEEKAGFANVRTHFLQHSLFAAQQAAQQAAAQAPKEQINFKDLDTPQEKDQMLKQANIQGNSQQATPPRPAAGPQTVQ